MSVESTVALGVTQRTTITLLGVPEKNVWMQLWEYLETRDPGFVTVELRDKTELWTGHEGEGV